jgi:hypothetical protein
VWSSKLHTQIFLFALTPKVSIGSNQFSCVYFLNMPIYKFLHNLLIILNMETHQPFIGQLQFSCYILYVTKAAGFIPKTHHSLCNSATVNRFCVNFVTGPNDLCKHSDVLRAVARQNRIMHPLPFLEIQVQNLGSAKSFLILFTSDLNSNL